ncbi:hypothetical protein N657DRAFT_668795 [Parathielavia appendiculata]|uniref:Heterokaryon incompatibility domain-containing protein n=1 Tax=Parathielavia appendiculata TaxID=2587402 RepID=A0AAN6U5H7_9PEZI|nr:hypothetical protein N657DRAFT_668795 [Parathielavia appendiculata]
MRGRRSRRLDVCERSRMGNAFRPPSPAPFVVVTEAATVRERQRDCVRQDTERAMRRLTSAAADSITFQGTAGFRKIQQTCAVAFHRDKLEYAWVDSCCIDKTSSAELTEAINSMFAWYRDAAVCYVFLADLEPGTEEDLQRNLPGCRYFTRGWTLQELIAPRVVAFFDKGWNIRGSKTLLSGLISLSNYAVARRMSWASRREPTRVEDMAYCLLGIFAVNMSLIYGEGIKAFTRLQTTIIQSTADLSIFVWKDDGATRREYSGVLAQSPRQFAGCGDVELLPGNSAHADVSITTRGIQTEASLRLILRWNGRGETSVLETFCYVDGHITLCPFRLGSDPVVGNRYSALQVNWGSFKGVRCRIPSSPVVLARLDDRSHAATMLLESQLACIGFEGSQQAESIVRDLFGDTIKGEDIYTEFGLVKYCRNFRGPNKLKPDAGMAQRRQGLRAFPTLRIRQEAQPDVCVNPITLLEYSRPENVSGPAGDFLPEFLKASGSAILDGKSYNWKVLFY